MRPSSLTVFLLIFLLASCAPQTPPPLVGEGPGVTDTPPPPTAYSASPTPTAPSPTSDDSTPDYPDKFSLWTNGAQLRGANIWQRIRIPDLDGDLLGDGYIGPPYAQSDFDRLAALGANYVSGYNQAIHPP